MSTPQQQKQRTKGGHNKSTQPQPSSANSISSSNRATSNGVTIGADLLTQPPPISKNLTHLVGRQLVPFFTADGDENSTHDLHQNANLDFGVDEDERGHGTQVRQFVDGYFVESGSLASNQTQPSTHQQREPNTQHSEPETRQQQQQKPKRRETKQQHQQSRQQQQAQKPQQDAQQPRPANQQQQQRSSQKQLKERQPKKGHAAAASASVESEAPGAAAPARLYAGAAFLASPSPLQVPLPKFLTNKPTPASPGSARRTAAASNGHAAAGLAHDPHASQSLMNMLRGPSAGMPPSPKLMQRENSFEKQRQNALAHPPSPSSASAAASFVHALAAQPTLLPSPQPIPQLPHTHGAHPHHGAGPFGFAPPPSFPHGAPYAPHAYGPPPGAHPSYYAQGPHPSMYAHAPPVHTGPAVPLISAVHNRYDRPNVSANHAASYYGQPQPAYGYGHAY